VTPKLLIDYDKLVNASKPEVAKACVRIFDRVQELPKEDQVLAMGACFILLCAATRVPAQDAFSAVSNLMKDPLTSSGLDVRFDAMLFHIREELLNGK
jgi:hypothetical protein